MKYIGTFITLFLLLFTFFELVEIENNETECERSEEERLEESRLSFTGSEIVPQGVFGSSKQYVKHHNTLSGKCFSTISQSKKILIHSSRIYSYKFIGISSGLSPPRIFNS